MSLPAILTLIVLLFILASLYFEILGPAFTFVIGVVVLTIFGVLTPKEMLAGFANEQVLVIIMLLLVGDVIRKTGVMDPWFDRLFRGTKSRKGFLLKMMLSVAAISAFMNNTPLVAIMMPYVRNWSRRNQINASKFLIPLSYATILGGCATLIGTSTNLVINGMVLDQKIIPDMKPLGMFDFAWVGIPMIILGVMYLYFFSNRLLPDTQASIDKLTGHEREYMVEAVIHPGSALVGCSIPNSGLLNLKGLSLLEIRSGVEKWKSDNVITPEPITLSHFHISTSNIRRIPSTSPEYIIAPGDLLFFTGNTHAVTELLDGYEGISLVEVGMFLNQEQTEVNEVVVSHNSSLISKTVAECTFRRRFDAVVLGIHRNGVKLMEKTADIRLHAGDVVLLLAGNGFQTRAEDTRDFYLLGSVREIQRPGLLKSLIILGGLALVVILSVLGVVKLIMGITVLLMALLVTKIANPKDVAKSIDYDLGLIIVMALALGTAMIKTGLAGSVAWGVINLTRPLGIIGVMTGLYAVTALLAAYITTKAAAALIFPIALSAALNMGLNPLPFVLITAFASAATFITPHGYQTNLMVYGPGGYRFKDFFRIGLPLTVLYMGVAIGILHLVFF
ncbi:MAG TPA: SLC13 family permease [Bacteroidales bacterium]|nr:SLC13 family permease [Bacteroidales bacterium]